MQTGPKLAGSERVEGKLYKGKKCGIIFVVLRNQGKEMECRERRNTRCWRVRAELVQELKGNSIKKKLCSARDIERLGKK